MIRFSKLEDSSELLEVPTCLDFAYPDASRDLPLLLRIHALFSEKLLIPSTFLLHNREVLSWYDQHDRGDLAGFLESDRLVVSMPSTHTSLSEYWAHAVNSDNPSALQGSLAEEYVGFLERYTEAAEARKFDLDSRLEAFEDLFVREARHRGISPAQLDTLLDLSKNKIAKRDAGFDGRGEAVRTVLTRSDLLILLGIRKESPGTPVAEIITGLNQEHPELLRGKRNACLEAAAAAYVQGVMEPLTKPYQAAVLRQDRFVSNAKKEHRLTATDDLVEKLIEDLSGAPREIRIDWESVRKCSWLDLRKTIEKHSRDYFRARREFCESPIGENLQHFLSTADEYLKKLAEEFPGKFASKLGTQLRGGYVTIGIILAGAYWIKSEIPIPFFIWLYFYINQRHKKWLERADENRQASRKPYIERCFTSEKWISGHVG